MRRTFGAMSDPRARVGRIELDGSWRLAATRTAIGFRHTLSGGTLAQLSTSDYFESAWSSRALDEKPSWQTSVVFRVRSSENAVGVQLSRGDFIKVQCDPGFLPLMSDFHKGVLETHHGVIYGVWPDGSLGYVNPAWQQFAVENDGEQAMQCYTLGRSIFSAMSHELQAFYQHAFPKCLNSQEAWRHEYQCSSTTTFRRHQMSTYPLNGVGLLVVNSLLIEHPINDEAREYVNEDGLLTQCWRCGRLVRPGERQQWDAIRSSANIQLGVTHHLCMICLCYHFPDISQPIVSDLLND